MSAQGRPGPSPPPAGPGQLGWALVVVAAALIGGLAAAALVHAPVTLAVIASVVIGGVAVLAVFRSPARPPEPGPAARAPAASRPPVVAQAAPRQPGPGGQDGETVVQLLPLSAQPDAPWWDSAQEAPPPSPGARRVPAPDLSTYLASTFIAQCPRCGAFRLDLRRAGPGWDFRCESCEYIWTWQPGAPWPPVRVMPQGRRE